MFISSKNAGYVVVRTTHDSCSDSGELINTHYSENQVYGLFLGFLIGFQWVFNCFEHV